jgi:hypothetical protein
MGKKTFLFIGLMLIIASVNLHGQQKNEIQKNKDMATKYHELNPANIDAILTVNFIGRNEKSRHTWNRENHRIYLTNGNYKVDSIFYQIAESDWVATRFFRRMEWQGDTVTFEGMHFKRFENGKIAEIWEYGDTQQVVKAEK